MKFDLKAEMKLDFSYVHHDAYSLHFHHPIQEKVHAKRQILICSFFLKESRT